MNAKSAKSAMSLYRKNGENSSLVQKAVQFAERESGLREALRLQLEIDARIQSEIDAIIPPDDLREQIGTFANDSAENLKAAPQFARTLLITMICGVLSIVGLLIAMEMDHAARFPGREAAERMLDRTSKMSGVELDPVKTNAGALSDWFYVHGYESYAIPSELSHLSALGCQVLKIDGISVAQVAIDQHATLLFVFNAAAFDVNLPHHVGWKTFEHGGWAGAIRRKGDNGIMLAFQGRKSDMDTFVSTLKK